LPRKATPEPGLLPPAGAPEDTPLLVESRSKLPVILPAEAPSPEACKITNAAKPQSQMRARIPYFIVKPLPAYPCISRQADRHRLEGRDALAKRQAAKWP